MERHAPNIMRKREMCTYYREMYHLVYRLFVCIYLCASNNCTPRLYRSIGDRHECSQVFEAVKHIALGGWKGRANLGTFEKLDDTGSI